MRAYVKACLWRRITRASLSWMQRRLDAAIARGDMESAARWKDHYARMLASHADLCEAIQHMRAAR